VVGVSPVFIFYVVALCAVVGAINSIIVVNIIAGELSLVASMALLVGCGGC